MTIQQEDDRKTGKFFIAQDGVQLAEMTYVYQTNNTIVIEHTNVDASLKGQGIGYKLAEATVAFARDKKLKIQPVCPFAVAVFKKKAEAYSDVIG